MVVKRAKKRRPLQPPNPPSNQMVITAIAVIATNHPTTIIKTLNFIMLSV